MTVHANYDNPRVVTRTFATTDTPTTCVGCGTDVDHDEFYALVTGPGNRTDILAVAHVEHWETDDELDTDCPDALRYRWMAQLADVHAGLLVPAFDHGGRRFYLGDEPIHCGTPLELLGADGHWQPGRFETTGPTDEPTPRFHYRVGGWDTPDVAITLPISAVLRLPPRREGSRW
jgi:hypothetical protein